MMVFYQLKKGGGYEFAVKVYKYLPIVYFQFKTSKTSLILVQSTLKEEAAIILSMEYGEFVKDLSFMKTWEASHISLHTSSA